MKNTNQDYDLIIRSFHNAHITDGHQFVPYNFEDTIRFIQQNHLFKYDGVTLKFYWTILFKTPEYGYMRKCVHTDIYQVFDKFKVGCSWNEVSHSMKFKWAYSNKIIRIIQQILNGGVSIQDLDSILYNHHSFSVPYTITLEDYSTTHVSNMTYFPSRYHSLDYFVTTIERQEILMSQIINII